MTKIAIATPAYGEMFFAPYVQSIFRLQRVIGRQGWDSQFLTVSYADISESRNFLLTHWFDKTDATHLLFVDADMGFEPKLVTDMLALDKAVVGAVYPKRQIDLKRLAADIAKGVPVDRATARAHDFVLRKRQGALRPRVENGFVEVSGCGAGVLLIRRDCVARLLAHAPELSDPGAKRSLPLAKDLDRLIRAFDQITLDGARLSEDYSFCQRWRDAGGEIWASISHPITHIGLRRFTARYDQAMTGPQITSRMVEGGQVLAGKIRIPKPGSAASKPVATGQRVTAAIEAKDKPRNGSR